MFDAEPSFPFRQAAAHAGAVVLCGSGACFARAGTPLVSWGELLRLLLIDVLVGVGAGILAVAVVHEGLHALLYWVAGRRPRLGGEGLRLFVSADRAVSRQLLEVQLRLVPWAAASAAAVLTVCACLIVGVADGPHSLLASALAWAVVLASGRADLGNGIFDAEPDAHWFRDKGSTYVPEVEPGPGS